MWLRTDSRIAGALIGAVAVFPLLIAGCGNDTGGDEGAESAAGDNVVQESDFVLEPATAPGQGAFTAPIDVAPDVGPVFQGIRGARQGGGCDKEMLKTELDQRPEAKAAYAQVLGISQDDVGGYIDTLAPEVLGENLKVTNHGLNEQGQAFPIASDLEAGTAVLVDKDEAGKLGGPQPVTRCRCGNPLLKAPEIGSARPEWVTTTTGDPSTTSSSTTTTSSTTTSSTTTTTTTTTSTTTPGRDTGGDDTGGNPTGIGSPSDGGPDEGSVPDDGTTDGSATDGSTTDGGATDGNVDAATPPAADTPAANDQVGTQTDQ